MEELSLTADSLERSRLLATLEAKAEEKRGIASYATWKFAVALTEIHDSKCYPGAGEPRAWETYVEERWGYKRAYAFKIVAWGHKEMVEIDAGAFGAFENNGQQYTTVDSQPTERVAPKEPQKKTERASRGSGGRRIPKAEQEKSDRTDLSHYLENPEARGARGFWKRNPEWKPEPNEKPEIVRRRILKGRLLEAIWAFAKFPRDQERMLRIISLRIARNRKKLARLS